MIKHYHLKLNDEKSVDSNFISLIEGSKNKVETLRCLFIFWDTFRGILKHDLFDEMIEKGGIDNAEKY